MQWLTLVATLALAGCIASDRDMVLSAASDTGDTPVGDADTITAPDDTAVSPDTVPPVDTHPDVLDTVVPADTVPDDTLVAEDVGSECGQDSDCSGPLAACSEWRCRSGYCQSAAFTATGDLAGDWLFTSVSITSSKTRTFRAFQKAVADGAWDFVASSPLLGASDNDVQSDLKAGTWCASSNGLVQMRRGVTAGQADTNVLIGHIASTGDVIALGTRDGVELAVLVKYGQGLPTDWTRGAAFHAIGLRGQDEALESYAGLLSMGGSAGACSGTFTTSRGETIDLSAASNCLNVLSDGTAQVIASATFGDDGAEANRWYGMFAAGGRILVLTHSTSSSSGLAAPYPGILVLVRAMATVGPTTLLGEYPFARIGSSGGPEAAWGSTHFALAGAIDRHNERQSGGATTGFDAAGCNAASSNCPGSFMFADNGRDRGTFAEHLGAPVNQERGGAAMAGDAAGEPAPLFVSYSILGSPTEDKNLGPPDRPSLGMHVRALNP